MSDDFLTGFFTGVITVGLFFCSVLLQIANGKLKLKKRGDNK